MSFFKTIDYKQLAERLRCLRDSSNLNEAEIAGRLMVSPQAVNKWMTGKTLPDLQHLCDLSELFGVSTDFILKGLTSECLNINKTDIREYIVFMSADSNNSVQVNVEFDKIKNTKDLNKRLKAYSKLIAA